MRALSFAASAVALAILSIFGNIAVTATFTQDVFNYIGVGKDEELHTCAGYSGEYHFVMFDITKPCSE